MVWVVDLRYSSNAWNFEQIRGFVSQLFLNPTSNSTITLSYKTASVLLFKQASKGGSVILGTLLSSHSTDTDSGPELHGWSWTGPLTLGTASKRSCVNPN